MCTTAPVPGGDLFETSTVAPERSSKCLGDEKAEAQAAASLFGIAFEDRPCRDIGLADPVEDVRGKARAVVGDRAGDDMLVPSGGDIDAAAREVGGVLDQIAEPVNDAWPAQQHRLGGSIALECHRRAAP